MMNKLLVACALMVVGGSALAAGTTGGTVPEPGTLALVALAVVAGVVARRGKK